MASPAEPEVSAESVDLGNMPPPLHALAGNVLHLSDEAIERIEDWVTRAELAAQTINEAAGRMESAAAEHNRAVTRERTGN